MTTNLTAITTHPQVESLVDEDASLDSYSSHGVNMNLVVHRCLGPPSDDTECKLRGSARVNTTLLMESMAFEQWDLVRTHMCSLVRADWRITLTIVLAGFSFVVGGRTPSRYLFYWLKLRRPRIPQEQATATATGTFTAPLIEDE
jgi:hypothetical protein